MCAKVSVCVLARSCGCKQAITAQRARTTLAIPRRMLHPNVASRTPGLTARLRDATAGVREDRDLLAGRVSWPDYRLFLVRMYGFHAALERALTASKPLAAAIADAPLRNHKASLLAADLVALGVDRRELSQLPRMTFAPLALPEALGWTYVIESATLSGKPLVRHLSRQLSAELQAASAYLRCYGDEAPERWRQLGVALDAIELTERDSDRVIDTACDGFVQLRTWVRPERQPRTTRIHA
jgi:heme oxygenase (biliverdin-IX-beta and delta-forming)